MLGKRKIQIIKLLIESVFERNTPCSMYGKKRRFYIHIVRNVRVGMQEPYITVTITDNESDSNPKVISCRFSNPKEVRQVIKAMNPAIYKNELEAKLSHFDGLRFKAFQQQ